MRARMLVVLAASLGLAACEGDAIPSATPAMTEPVQEELLTLVTAPPLSNVQQRRLSVVRERGSSAQVSLARVQAAPAQRLNRKSALRLQVAPGISVVADGEAFTQRAPGDVSWSGSVRGGVGRVQLVMVDGAVTGTITVDRTTWSVAPLGDGLHSVTRIDQSGLPPEHSPDNPSGALRDDFGGALQARVPAGGGTVGALANTTINVAVVYTASVLAAAPNIASMIQLAVDETNQSYVNSGINITFNRVYTGQVTYNEASRSFTQHTNALALTADGLMDNVHTLRNTYAADVVLLVVNDSEACGQAAAINATAASAFAVADYTCITGYYSFGHEIGHLQGARHDRYVDASTSPYSYGHGFIPASKTWRTVMSYGNNCSNCTRIQYWSNPLKTYGGVAMGTALYEDNARVLNLTAPVVGAFR